MYHKGMFGKVYRYAGYFWWAYRLTQGSGMCRYRVRTQPYRSVQQGIEAVPNLTEGDRQGIHGATTPCTHWHGLNTLPTTPPHIHAHVQNLL